MAAQLSAAGINAKYEETTLAYEQPVKPRRYTPDFILPNGVVIETKGYFVPEDRNKMAWIKEQHPEIDVRMVFSNSKAALYKGSKTTYGMWCDKHGIPYADKLIPNAWLTEAKCPRRLAAIRSAAVQKANSQEPNRDRKKTRSR